jgi:ketosteroid isomerase-like protein
MSEENVEIVRRVYQAAARRDSAATLALYDPDVEWDISHAPARELIAGSHHYAGHEGLQRFFREWHEAWENVEADYEELIDVGENVVSVETTRGRGRRSGVEVDLTHSAVWTIRTGKIVRVVWFATRAEALEAAGQTGHAG